MKDKLIKVKRKRVDWYRILLDEHCIAMDEDFWAMKSRHPFMSNNRIAYNVLKRYHSTTTLQYIRYCGGLQEYLEFKAGERII